MTGPVPFYIVTGFLGSGKTTFLKNWIKENRGKGKICIIQNEFASANVERDGIQPHPGEIKILEINNGSVFCLCLLHDFIGSLSSFVAKNQPDLLILEASGLSDPIAIAQLFDNELLKDNVYLKEIWSIVDAKNFSRSGKFIQRVEHQIRVADHIIVNKADLVTKNDLVSIQKVIREINPFADITSTSFCEIKDHIHAKVHEPLAIKNKSINAEIGSKQRPSIVSGVLKTVKPIGLAELNVLLNKYSIKTIRIKGPVKTREEGMVAVQSVFEQFTIRKLDNYTGPTELVILAENFDLRTFNNEFKLLSGKNYV